MQAYYKVSQYWAIDKFSIDTDMASLNIHYKDIESKC